MKVLVFDSLTAHLIVSGVLQKPIYRHGDYLVREVYRKRYPKQVVIKASERGYHVDQVSPETLEILKSIGVDDPFLLPYKTVVGMADVQSIERLGGLKYQWSLTNIKKVKNPITKDSRKEFSSMWEIGDEGLSILLPMLEPI